MKGIRELVFLGTGVSAGVPVWFCNCEVCEAARIDSTQYRTRSSLALLGEETTLIDAAPDISFQLNRERIHRVDQVFLTHWHLDHVYGLGFLGEAVMLTGWNPIDVYIPEGDIQYFERQMHFMERFVKIHPVQPGMTIELADATYEVVKTQHTEASVGYIVNSGKRFAYYLDTGYPTPEMIEQLTDIDFLIVEATLDFIEQTGVSSGMDIKKLHLGMDDAYRLWKDVGCPECIFTHFACHGFRGDIGDNPFVQGFTHKERLEYAAMRPGLTIAYDGMRVGLPLESN